MEDIWKEYEADFNAMDDEQIEAEFLYSMHLIEEHESWIEAVTAWKAAGKPRNGVTE